MADNFLRAGARNRAIRSDHIDHHQLTALSITDDVIEPVIRRRGRRRFPYFARRKKPSTLTLSSPHLLIHRMARVI
jgi:hypothetical protein